MDAHEVNEAMNRYVLLGFLVLTLLALPTAVAAAESATTDIKGSVTTTLSVTVDNSELNLGAMDVGNNPPETPGPGYVTTTVHVTTSGPITGWALTAKDIKLADAGYLINGADEPLTNALGFTWDSEAWTDLITPKTIAGDIVSPFPPTDTAVFFRQEVVAGDPTGNFAMTVQFNVGIA